MNILDGAAFADVVVVLDESGIPKRTLVNGVEVEAVSDVNVLAQPGEIVKAVITINARTVTIARPKVQP
jgi:hypothetical protein